MEIIGKTFPCCTSSNPTLSTASIGVGGIIDGKPIAIINTKCYIPVLFTEEEFQRQLENHKNTEENENQN
jgi:hypothetical protein